MRVRLVLLLALATAAIALIAAGCGGGDDSGSDPAALAPPQSPVYVEVALRPEGALKSNLEALAKKVAGIDNLGDLIVEELEGSAVSGDQGVDYEKEIEPWLGEKAGISLQEYDGDDFGGYGIAVQSTDTAATQDFIDKQAADEVAEESSYEGTDFKVEEDGEAVGVIGDFLAFAEDAESFKAMVDASEDESLLDQDSYGAAIDEAPDESFADVFVDVGALIEESGGVIDPDAQQLLETAGIDPREATAIASLVPGQNQIEIDFSTNAAAESAPTGDASTLLGEMPGGAFAAAAAPAVGDSLGEAIDGLDESGIPGEIPPNQLKKTLKAAGIDLDRISASIGDVGLFAEGNTARNLTGALVIETTSEQEATNTVANIGLLLREAEVAGVTALSDGATGFSIRSENLGSQPLVAAAAGNRIAISYGLAASALALRSGDGATLSSNPQYKEAVAALGDTPISAFVAGPAALALARNILSDDDLEGLEQARPALDKVAYIAAGTGTSGDLATAKLIVGFTK